MRILLDQAVYDMRNKGNVALLQMALRRIHQLWPEASLEVMTDAPHLLGLYCPEAFPVNVFPEPNWSENRQKFERFHRFVPPLAIRSLFEVREELQYRGLTSHGIRTRLKTFGKSQPSLPESYARTDPLDPDFYYSPDLEQAIRGADLVIATGGGYLVDTDRVAGYQVLARLDRAKQMGKFTALVGQGLGQIDDVTFREMAKKVLPTVDFIMVRENDYAVPFLRSLGVPAERIYMSGDDAVELAHEARTASMGNHIGVSMRQAHYTNLESQDLTRLRPILHQAAARYGAPLIGISTSCCGPESDQFRIGTLLEGYPKASNNWLRFDSTLELIQRVGRCRVMVASAFHGAVFALAQGIPTIGLVKTNEYSIKFGALVDQFAPGCQLLSLADEQLPEKLVEAINQAWERAEQQRPSVLKAAEAQIQLGQLGYQRLYEAYQVYRQSRQRIGQLN